MTASEQAPGRFKPTRAGIINLWDYFDEEFVFADGRLALRGHNGSGKTKALEVLFPFVLDGGLDARRLDPFSGENRTMKANLLYRGQDSEHGYVWLEFSRPALPSQQRGDTVTLIIALRAHKNWERARPAFFITGMRLGIDFGLLSSDSRPLTARQLTAILGRDAAYGDRRRAYQEAVDARLFGLGPERYAQLIDLLIALRRPLLAKDLDPVKVSDTLTAGLSPVDEDLVDQAARDFENLAAVQRQYDDLAAADAAVRAFLIEYTAYLKAHAKYHVEQVAARIDTAAGNAAAIATAARVAADARQAEGAAAQAAELAGIAVQTFEARLFALKNRDAYKDHEKLALRREQLEKEARRLAADRSQLERATANVTELRAEADKVADRRDELGRAGERQARALAVEASGGGLLSDGEPADTGPDLLVTTRARVAARRDDIAQVRACLDKVAVAERSRQHAETELGKARKTLDDRDAECGAAQTALAGARAEVARQQAAWTRRWTGEQPGALVPVHQAEVLTAALDRIGEPDAASLTETFTALTQERASELIAEREQLGVTAASLAGQLEHRKAERKLVADEKDDAPPASDLRPAERAGRPGAPLWQLVRFADGLPPAAAAGIEGALYGAGMLTAWIHPDPALTYGAVAGTEADGYLVAAPADAGPSGRTLADVLVPEEQDLVPAALVQAVLRSILVVDKVDAASGPETRMTAGAPVVTLSAQYSYGVQLGARPKDAPEFVGATNRANRRRARLAEIDAQVEELERQCADVAARRQSVVDLLADLGRAQRELPRTAPITATLSKVTSVEGQRVEARKRLAAAQETLDAAIAELDLCTRRLRNMAADRSLPASADAVNAVEQAVAEFDRVAQELVRTRADTARLDDDMRGRLARVAKLTADNGEAALVLAENQAAYAAAAEKLSVEERVSGAEYEAIRHEIDETDSGLREAKDEQKSATKRQASAHDDIVRADKDLAHGRIALATALGELVAQTTGFEPYAHLDLRPLLQVSAAMPWPPATQWPVPGDAADQLVARLDASDDGPADYLQAVRELLPESAVTVLDAYTTATGGGRAVTDGVLKGTVDRMWTAYREFESSLKAGEDGYQADLGGDAVFVIDVVTSEGRMSAASFARKIAEEAENQGILLEQRERAVLEDSLLTALAQQIHSRVLAAKDLVDQMDADTRSKPMSSGMAIGIRWVRSDKLSEPQAQVSRLLDRDAASLGPEGLGELRGLLRDMIHDHRTANRRDTYREVLAAVLDYRSWHAFELRMLQPGSPPERLTRKKHSEMSGGEKSAAIHLPLFAAANALYSSARPGCPRLIALDEAFAGIDDIFKPELLGLTVKFDLDLFMTGHDLWVRYPTVPAAAHYDMHHDKPLHALSALLVLWDGDQLIDAAAGFAGNEELAQALLGFRPTRYMPVGAGDAMALTTSADSADDAEDEDDED